jgi:hypothetical protein
LARRLGHQTMRDGLLSACVHWFNSFV